MLKNKLLVLGLISVLQPVFAQHNPELKPDPTDTTSQIGARLPIFSTTSDDNGADMGSQDISGLLQSSRDVFSSTAGFNFGNARFRIRGLGSENTVVMINGVRINNLETGWASWSNWGGLNDVTRWMEVRTSISASDVNFGGVGGYANLNVRASNIRKGTRVSYALSNRSYNHRFMVTHSTGVMKNGWAFAFSASKRYASEGYVEGTFFDAHSYLFSAEKIINSKHTISFVGFGAPMTQGRQGLAVQEIYDLTGNNFYNPNWGYQNGEKRNARVSTVHKPLAMLSHIFKINEKSKLETSVTASVGRSNLTGINWFQAKDPRPDYYRYLPSYYTEDLSTANRLADEWANNTSYSQIDWDALYFANSKNLYTIQNEGGVAGNNVTGNRSKYIVENNHTNSTLAAFNSIYNNQLTERLKFSGGLNYTYTKLHYFKTVNDLLGGDFWLDVNNFALIDFADDNLAQNDINNPNKALKVGDKFGHEYEMHLSRSEVFGQIEYKREKIETYAGLMLSTTSFYRNGIMENSRFSEGSIGKSDVNNFFNYGVKGGLSYKITGRHYVSSNLSLMTRSPIPANSFMSPRYHNGIVSDLRNEEIMSGDINYNIRYPKLRSRASLYYTKISNITQLNSYYHDEYMTIVNYLMTNVGKQMMGLEFGVEYNLAPTVTVNAVAAYGDHRYNSRPNATISRDNSSELLAENRTIYLKNFRLGGMPQQAYSAGVKYTHPKYWYVGANFNYFADIYLEPNPDRRTVEALGNLVNTDPEWSKTLDQTRFDNQYTVDVYGGKSWKIKKYFLNWSLNMNNVLNNRSFVTGGFEQLRYQVGNIDRFPPKLSYHFGFTFYTMLSLRF
jgi:hypothetical protein